MIKQLNDHRLALAAIIDDPDPDPAAASRQFQAAALHTETALTNELHRWRLITHRDEYDLSI